MENQPHSGQDAAPRTEQDVSSDAPRPSSSTSEITVSESASVGAHSDNRLLVYGFGLAFVLGCAVALSPSAVDPDLWGHVQYAEDALADGRLHPEATHTFTAEGHRWINHENLAELSVAFVYRALGARGLLLVKCLLGLAVIGLMIHAARRRHVSYPVVCGLMLLVATSLTAFWPVRPQLLSFVIFAVLLALLERAFAGWDRGAGVAFRWLLSAPLLFVIWTNSHGGFVAGVAIFAVYMACRGVEAVYRQGRAGWATAIRLNSLAALCILATLVNPYGLELHAWLVDALRNPRPEISEWAAPRPSDPFFTPFVALALVAAASLWGTKKRRDWTQILILVAACSQAALHLRHIAFFALLCGFWLPEHVASLVARFKPAESPDRRDQPLSPLMRRTLTGGLALTFVLLGARLYQRLHDFPVERDRYPVSAIQFMADNSLHGKLVVSFNWAQYAIAALAPDTTVAFDGRFRTCYPQEVVDMHFDFLLGDAPGRRFRCRRSGPVDPARVLRFNHPDLVLLDRKFEHSERVMESQPGWTLLYQDEAAQVWGRRAKYGRPESPDYLAESARRISNEPQVGSVIWPALPRPSVPTNLVGNSPPTDDPTPQYPREDRS